MPRLPKPPSNASFWCNGDPDDATVFQQVLKDNHFNDVLYPTLGDCVDNLAVPML
jgi:hypothetical protein